MRKRIFPITILLIFLISIMGCSSSESKYDSAISSEQSTSSTGGNTEIGFNKDVAPQLSDTTTATTPDKLPQGSRKIIDRADLTLETLEFDKSITSLESNLNSYDGYIESSNILQDGIMSGNYKQNRIAEFIIRVPKEKFQDFLTDTGKIGVVTNKRVYGEDISGQYYDNESRLKVLKVQEDKYLELLSNAKEIKEILEIEKALTEIRYEIESLTGYLKQMDSLVSYSTINLNISEVSKTQVAEVIPKTFSEKIIKAFSDSIKSLKIVGIAIILLVVAILPYAAIISILVYIIYFIVKKYKLNKNK